jgi:hypothetical protein
MGFTSFSGSSAGATTSLKQFNVTSYGAVGNGQMVVDGAMNGTTGVLTCATSAPFKTTDVGKTILVNGALGTGNTLSTTIASYQSASQVTLAAVSTAAVSSACVLWWTDDTAAFQAAINAATAYMNSSGLSAQVYKPPPTNGLFHGIGNGSNISQLVNTGTANGQLVIPTVYTVGTPQQTLYFYADITRSLPLWTQTAWAQVSNALVSSVLFTSTASYVSNTASFGKAGVISSTPSQVSLVALIDGLPAFQNIHVVFQNWTIVTPSSNNGWNLSGFQMGGISKSEFQGCASLITTNYNATSGANQFPAVGTLQNGLSVGIIHSGNGNNDDNTNYNPTVSGYAYGLQIGEHAVVIAGREIGCFAAILLMGNDGVANAHMVKIMGNSVELCSITMYISSAGSAGFTIDADFDMETSNALNIQDNNSGAAMAALFGEVRVYGQATVANFASGYPIGFKLRNLAATAPGWIFSYGGFTTAGTNVAVQNPYGRDARIVVTGGTVTAVKAGITIGGTGGVAATAPTMTAIGYTATPFEVDWPAYGWISITFSVAPTVDVIVL